MIRSLRYIFFLTVLLGTGASAQDLPPLEIENVTVIGKRMVVLPKARKGEVLDTSLYFLPPGDTMLFGERISNLGGTGGAIPGFREFEAPVRIDAEASIGSYLSPRGLVRVEYIRRSYDVVGMLDYRSTAGHIDSAEASSLLIGGRGSVLIGDEIPPLKSFRISLGLDHSGDGYFLYGNPVTPFDRSRSSTQFDLGVKSEEDTPIAYEVGMRLTRTSVEDRRIDTVRDVSATEPAFRFDLGADIGASLRGMLHVDFITSGLNYSTPTQTPATIMATADVEWSPSPRVFITGGISAASGEHSDDSSSSLLLPRLSIRFEASEQVSLFAWYAPELRAATYRARIMEAPYVDREITLRPEVLPVNLVGGVRLFFGDVTVEGRAFLENAESTPVVVVESTPGMIRWTHVDSRSVGGQVSVRVPVGEMLSISGDAIIQSTRADGTDEEVSMTPALDIGALADFVLNPEIDIFGTLQFQSDQRTSLDDALLPDDARRIPARFLIGGGGSYRIMENLRAFVEVSNLLNYQYELWQNYSAPGFEIRGGVRVRL